MGWIRSPPSRGWSKTISLIECKRRYWVPERQPRRTWKAKRTATARTMMKKKVKTKVKIRIDGRASTQGENEFVILPLPIEFKYSVYRYLLTSPSRPYFLNGGHKGIHYDAFSYFELCLCFLTLFPAIQKHLRFPTLSVQLPKGRFRAKVRSCHTAKNPGKSTRSFQSKHNWTNEDRALAT